jgi:hypothetical protein
MALIALGYFFHDDRIIGSNEILILELLAGSLAGITLWKQEIRIS